MSASNQVASPLNACGGEVDAAPVAGAAALVARGNCSFTDKAWALQRAGFSAMLLFNNEEGELCECSGCLNKISCRRGRLHLVVPCLNLRPLYSAALLPPSGPADCVLMSANRSEAQGLTLAVASLTEEAGSLLQRELAEQPGRALLVTLRMPAEGPVDWSSLVLWLIATGTVTAGGLWAGHGHLAGLGRESATPTARKSGAADPPSVTISSGAAVAFVALASAMLLALFFFLDKWLAYVLVSPAPGPSCP